MSMMSLLAFVVSPVVRMKRDRLSAREVEMAKQLAAARDENLQLRKDVARLVDAQLRWQAERDLLRAALFGAAPENQANALRQMNQQVQVVWCNCVPSRSQVWASSPTT